MTVGFDDLPYEILWDIINYLKDNRDDLCECRLVCKRWQFLAETHLYSILNLEYESNYGIYMYRPELCKYVKRIYIDDPLTLDDSFFQKFPNIEWVGQVYFLTMDLKTFNEVFTSKRCKLKSLPAFESFDSGSYASYCEACLNHHKTLEQVEISNIYNPSAESLQIVQHLDRFTNLKSLSLRTDIEWLEEYDRLLDKCPKLETLFVDFTSDEDRIYERAIPKHRHTRRMIEIKLHLGRQDGTNVYTFFINKFPNVKSWIVRAGSVEKEAQWIPDDAFRKMIKADSFTYKTCMLAADVPLKVGRLYSISHIPKSMCLTCVGASTTQRLIPGRNNVAIVDLELGTNSSCKKNSQQQITDDTQGYSVSIEYFHPGMKYQHLIEATGHMLHELRLDVSTLLPPINGHEFDAGGTLEYIMHQGRSLRYLYFKCLELHNTESYQTDIPPHQHIRTLILDTRYQASTELIRRIVEGAPYIETLWLSGDILEEDNNNDVKTHLIDLPNTNLNILGFKLRYMEEKDLVIGLLEEGLNANLSEDVGGPSVLFEIETDKVAYFMFKEGGTVEKIDKKVFEKKRQDISSIHVHVRCKSLHEFLCQIPHLGTIQITQQERDYVARWYTLKDIY